MLEKGIIIVPDFIFDGHVLNLRGLSGQTLRQSLLYWDRIEFPTNNIINFGTSPDLQFLIDEKVLQRTDIRLQGFSGNVGFGLIQTQIEAFKKLNAEEPGQWSLAQSANSLCFGSEILKTQSVIEFELHKCMPIPTSDVPFAEILEFKQRRQDEYTAFKNYIGDIYLEIVNSADIPRAKINAINKLESALIDIDRVTSESFTKRIFKSFSLNLNPANLAARSVTGAASATVFGFPVSMGATAGAVAGSINFNLSNKSIPDSLVREQKGLAYLVKASAEFESKAGRNELCPCGSGKKYKKCCAN